MTTTLERRSPVRATLRIVGALAIVAALAGCSGPGGGTLGVNSVTITNAPASNQLTVGATVALGVSVSVSGGVSQAVTWFTSNAATASVDANGVVGAKALGNTTITATSTVDVSKKDSLELTVVTGGACAPLQLEVMIDEPTTLTNRGDACPDYVTIDISVYVYVPLTIEPGVTIAFREGVRMSIELGGSITAVGTSSQPITFTGQVKVLGSWPGLEFDSDLPSVLEHVVVEYGATNIRLRESNVTLKNSTLRHSLDIGLEAISNFADSDLTEFTNNTFSDNAVAMRLHVGNLTQLDSASTYAEPGSGTVIEVTGGSSGTRAAGTWLATDAPYVITNDIRIAHAITIEDAAVFLIEEGVLIDVTVGALTATGTSVGIVFAGTEDVPGHWDGIYFRSDEPSVFDDVTVAFGGGQAGNSANITMFPDAALTLTNSTIAHSADYGLFVIGDVNITPDNATDLLAQNTFLNNASGDIEGLD